MPSDDQFEFKPGDEVFAKRRRSVIGTVVAVHDDWIELKVADDKGPNRHFKSNDLTFVRRPSDAA